MVELVMVKALLFVRILMAVNSSKDDNCLLLDHTSRKRNNQSWVVYLM